MGEQAVRSITTRYIILFIGVMISVLLSRALAATGRGAYAYIIAFASSVAWASMTADSLLLLTICC